MCLFPIKIVSSPSCSSSVKLWRQSIGQGGILDAHHAVWVWWKSKTGTHHNVVRAFPLSMSRHCHHRCPKKVEVVLRWVLVIRWLLNGEGAWLVRQIWRKWDQSRIHGFVVVFNLRLFLAIYLSQVRRCLKFQNKINSKWCSNYDDYWLFNRSYDLLRFCPNRKEMLLKIGQWLCNDILTVDVFDFQSVKQWEPKPPTFES